MSLERGRLIVFEGLDRSGKSTQCARLVEHLHRSGRNVEHMRFPDRTTVIGKMIDQYIRGSSQQEDHVIHLLFSANRWEACQAIKNHIEAGTDVVIDRYYYSGCVYSAAKRNPAMSLEWCRKPEVGLPRPDICLFLNISAAAAAQRGGYGTERYERQEIQDQVRKLYAELRRHADEAEDIVEIDASQSLDEVEHEIQEALHQRLGSQRAALEPLRAIREW